MKKSLLALGLFAAVAIGSQNASAMTLNVLGALGIPNGSIAVSSPTVMAGGELTFGFSPIHLGLFYENYFLSASSPQPSDNGNQRLYGALVRLGLSEGLWADAKLGLTSDSQFNTTSDTVFGFGLDLGYQMSMAPGFSVSPFIGYRYLPTTFNGIGPTRNMYDAGLMFSFGF